MNLFLPCFLVNQFSKVGFWLCTSVMWCASIVSGKRAAFFKANEPTKLYILQDKYKLKGTLISVRIPYPVKEVDIYEFLQ